NHGGAAVVGEEVVPGRLRANGSVFAAVSNIYPRADLSCFLLVSSQGGTLMSDVPDEPKESAGDVAYAVAKASVSGVPVVGGSAAELLGLVFGPPLVLMVCSVFEQHLLGSNSWTSF